MSWSSPRSWANLPKDPPSKTATLHKKDETDTVIFFKWCGTACRVDQPSQHFRACSQQTTHWPFAPFPTKTLIEKCQNLARSSAGICRHKTYPKTNKLSFCIFPLEIDVFFSLPQMTIFTVRALWENRTRLRRVFLSQFPLTLL